MAAIRSHWAGRVALVTGASVGIGRDVAITLCRRLGMRVVGCARRADKLAAVGKEATAPGGVAGGDFLGVACDLTNDASIARMFDEVDRWTRGRVDVLINNAGMGEPDTVLEGRSDAWRRMFELNCVALLTCTREAVKRMDGRRHHGCYVVNVSSMSGHRQGGLGVYSATKFAVRAITEATRRELRAKDSMIRVGAISPGLVETEFALSLTKDEAAAAKVYEDPVLQAPDITAGVLYMLGTPPHVEVNDILVRPTRQKM